MNPEGVQSAARGAWELGGGYSIADPPFLFLLPLALLFFAVGRGRRGRPRGRVSVLPAGLPRSWRQRLGWLPPLFQLVALMLVVASLARPLRGNVEREIVSEGVDIALLVDRSGSMRFDDLERDRTRLDVVKEVVADFAARRMSDRVAAADSVALVTFARFPRLLCPFTLDVDAVRGLLEDVEIVRFREEDGTAIGVALAKAVSVLRETESKSKVVVLLTDGENNVHDITPEAAAELAAEEGIRVYTIYAARYRYVHDAFRGYVPDGQAPDTTQLESIAELTGGRFYHARDRESLEEIYREIESLERTERRELRYEESFDLYLYLLLPAIALYGLSWLSSATWARRVA